MSVEVEVKTSKQLRLSEAVALPQQRRTRGHHKATLIKRYGPDKNMVDPRLELAAGWPKIAANQVMGLCGVYYPDRIGR